MLKTWTITKRLNRTTIKKVLRHKKYPEIKENI